MYSTMFLREGLQIHIERTINVFQGLFRKGIASD